MNNIFLWEWSDQNDIYKTREAQQYWNVHNNLVTVIATVASVAAAGQRSIAKGSKYFIQYKGKINNWKSA